MQGYFAGDLFSLHHHFDDRLGADNFRGTQKMTTDPSDGQMKALFESIDNLPKQGPARSGWLVMHEEALLACAGRCRAMDEIEGSSIWAVLNDGHYVQGNIFVLEADAIDCKTRLDKAHPNERREIVALRAQPKAAAQAGQGIKPNVERKRDGPYEQTKRPVKTSLDWTLPTGHATNLRGSAAATGGEDKPASGDAVAGLSDSEPVRERSSQSDSLPAQGLAARDSADSAGEVDPLATPYASEVAALVEKTKKIPPSTGRSAAYQLRLCALAHKFERKAYHLERELAAREAERISCIWRSGCKTPKTCESRGHCCEIGAGSAGAEAHSYWMVRDHSECADEIARLTHELAKSEQIICEYLSRVIKAETELASLREAKARQLEQYHAAVLTADGRGNCLTCGKSPTDGIHRMFAAPPSAAESQMPVNVPRYARVGGQLVDIKSVHFDGDDSSTRFVLAFDYDALRQQFERVTKAGAAMSANQCLIDGGIVGDDGGTPYCTMKLRAEAAEQRAEDTAGVAMELAARICDEAAEKYSYRSSWNLVKYVQCDTANNLAAAIRAAISQPDRVREMVRDAERWRYARDRLFLDADQYGTWYTLKLRNEPHGGESVKLGLDAETDAAMAARQEDGR